MLITLSVPLFVKPKVRLVLAQWSCVDKYCYLRAISNIFLLFRVPLVTTSPTAPIHTDLCPSAPNFSTFCQPTRNIMSGEISPSIWPNTMPCIPAYARVYLVFLPARTHIPYCTHPHPFTRICACSDPQLQCILMRQIVISIQYYKVYTICTTPCTI